MTNLFKAIFVVVSLFAALPALPAVTSYSDETLFSTAAVALVPYSFEGIAADSNQIYYSGGFVTVGPAKFTSNGDAYVYGKEFFTYPADSSFRGYNGAPENTITVSFPGASASAIGVVYGSANFANFPFTVTLSTGDAFNLSLPSTNSTPTFIGFISTTPITSVVFSHSSVVGTEFDIIRFSAAITPVPEPSMALMFGVGLALLGAIARRRRD